MNRKIIKFFSPLLALVLALAAAPVTLEANAAAIFLTEPMLVGGTDYAVALKSDGTVWAWGSNSYGELGDGTTKNRTAPTKVKKLSNVKAIAAGHHGAVALKNDGTVWAWGSDDYGAWDNRETNRTVPVQIKNLSGVQAVSAGYDHTVALKNDGTVWAWGDNGSGQLGDGTGTIKKIPVKVKSLSGVRMISAGHYHTLALKNDGTVWTWGDNSLGQLGDGTTTGKKLPVKVKNLNNMKAISAGNWYAIAQKNDGTLWAWGDNRFGQFGDGTTSDRKTTPVQIKTISNVQAFSAGGYHTMALKNDGTIWTWGNNGYGQLGDGTRTQRTAPVQLKNLKNVKAITAIDRNTVALKNDGAVWAWGVNFGGILGEGADSKLTPVQIKGTGGKGYLNLIVENYVSLRIGYTKAIQNGVQTTIDSAGTKPLILGGRTMIPLRFVGEKMGATVNYVNTKTPITLVYGAKTVKVTLGSKKMTVTENGKTKTITLDVAAQLKDGKTYIPLRAVGEALDFTVYYDADTKIIIVANLKMSASTRNTRLSEAKAYIK